MKRVTAATAAALAAATLWAAGAGAGWLDKARQAMEGLQSGSAAPTAAGLAPEEIAGGLRDALRVGAEKAAARASAVGGFLDNPAIRIPLPGKLQTAANALKMVGLGGQARAFEETLNRAAEKAAAKAVPIFGEAVSKLTFDDVHRIWKGGDTAATEYLGRTTRPRLQEEFRPVVHAAAQEVGVTRSYQELTGRPEVAALVAGSEFDLDHYVTDQAMNGLFALLAEEERQIRTNPVARTTDLLKKVFGP